jgi:leucyl aminopeptidase
MPAGRYRDRVPPRTRRSAGPAPLADRASTVTVGESLGSSWHAADIVAVGVAAASGGGSAPVPSDAARLAAERYEVDLDAVTAAERVAGRAGEVVRVPVQAPDGLPARLLLVGTGAGSATDLRRAGAALARAVRGRDRVLTSLAHTAPADAVQALVEGLLLGGYSVPATGTRRRTDSLAARRVELLGRVPAAAVSAGTLHATATLRARDLAATPSDVKNPAWVAGRARELADGAGLAVRVWDERELAAEGFGGLLAVGGGSATPPRLVQVDYEPAASRRRGRVVLAGKGITYDTGGLSIKPREAMVPMKTDMTGAAVVLATLAACAEAGVRRPVTGLLALAENAVGADSYRPGDVVTHYGGRTVEVSNTDAEGRMVLADALAFADAQLDPEIVVDVATLTGAATLGLGRRHAALFTPDDRLATGLDAAGRASGEQVWRMPLVEEYRQALDSSVADLRHVTGDPKVGAGAVVAALFLREFAGRRRWAHLDIAGPARSDKDEHEVTRGPTGYGARLLLRWLEGLR